VARIRGQDVVVPISGGTQAAPQVLAPGKHYRVASGSFASADVPEPPKRDNLSLKPPGKKDHPHVRTQIDLEDGSWLSIAGPGTVRAKAQCQISAARGANIILWGSGNQVSLDNATCEAWYGANQVVGQGHSIINAGDLTSFAAHGTTLVRLQSVHFKGTGSLHDQSSIYDMDCQYGDSKRVLDLYGHLKMDKTAKITVSDHGAVNGTNLHSDFTGEVLEQHTAGQLQA
jgi:hypothetical protein